MEIELGAGLPREILRELAQLLGEHRGTAVEHTCTIREAYISVHSEMLTMPVVLIRFRGKGSNELVRSCLVI